MTAATDPLPPAVGAVAELVDRVRAEPELRDELVPLLREDHWVYAGRGTSSAARLRGWLLSVFAEVGLPDEAVPSVLDDLSNEVDPVCVAGAAVAVRGMAAPPRPVAVALLAALRTARARDAPVVLAAPGIPWSSAASVSPVAAVLDALRCCRLDDDLVAKLVTLATEPGWNASAAADLGRTVGVVRARAGRSLGLSVGSVDSVVSGVGVSVAAGDDAPPADGRGSLAGVTVQDQAGERLSLASFLAAAPTVLTFFYTRCTNPNKCSLTVTKLADLQRLLGDGPVQLAAVSYDPGYDLPGRMAVYGAARGVEFGPRVRMLRALDGHDALLRYFRLRVGYSAALVNRHAVEVFLLDGERIAASWAQLPWSVAEVAAAARGLTPS